MSLRGMASSTEESRVAMETAMKEFNASQAKYSVDVATYNKTKDPALAKDLKARAAAAKEQLDASALAADLLDWAEGWGAVHPGS